MAFNVNDYEPVEVRLARFWEQYPNGSVQTELVHHSETQFIVKAFVYADRENLATSLLATGYAEEKVDPNPKRVNFASALENGETSAIGRALANANFAPKGARPSREEMQKAARRQAGAAVGAPTKLDELKGLLNTYSPDKDVRKKFVLDALEATELGSLNDLNDNEIGRVLQKLNEAMSAPFTK
jgi:hypothetical protein